jgi:hypothetical protein
MQIIRNNNKFFFHKITQPRKHVLVSEFSSSDANRHSFIQCVQISGAISKTLLCKYFEQNAVFPFLLQFSASARLPPAQHKQRPPEHVNTAIKTDVKSWTCATEFGRVQKARPFGGGTGSKTYTSPWYSSTSSPAVGRGTDGGNARTGGTGSVRAHVTEERSHVWW